MENDDSLTPEIMNQLQDLLVRNPELEQLESMLDRFNIFEALGAVRQEVRHSDFLAFLLNPRQNHGLGEVFVKRLLQEAISQAEFDQPITPIDLDLWDLDDLEIRREWQSIDLFLLHAQHQFAVIIENKIYSGEHSNQLARYYQVVKQYYPTYKVVCLFLTPDGTEASVDNYINIGYEVVCRILEDLVRTRESTLGRDILVMIDHYTKMLRRYIVGESELEKLCQQIYRKHQRALDLIYEYRPDIQSEIKDYLVELIEANPLLTVDHVTKTGIYFLPKKWDIPHLQVGQGWTPSGRLFLFLFNNQQDFLKLSLILGPGDEEVRIKLFEVISQNEPPFKRAFKKIGKKWSNVYTRNILTKNNYQDNSAEDLFPEIKRRFKEFMEHEYPKIVKIIDDEIAGWS